MAGPMTRRRPVASSPDVLRAVQRGGERVEAQPFSFALYLRHREWQAGLVFVLVMLWFAVLRPRAGT